MQEEEEQAVDEGVVEEGAYGGEPEAEEAYFEPGLQEQPLFTSELQPLPMTFGLQMPTICRERDKNNFYCPRRVFPGSVVLMFPPSVDIRFFDAPPRPPRICSSPSSTCSQILVIFSVTGICVDARR